MREEKALIWTRDFTLLWFTNFLMALGFYFLLPTLPFYAISLGANEAQVGYIVGIYTLSALAIRPLAGYALDFWGRKKVYLLALAWFAVLIAAYPFATSLLALLLIRFVHGLSWGVTTTGGGTIIADLVPPKRRGESVGYFGLTMTLAMALGPAIGLWIMGKDKFTNLFLASGILIAIAFLLATFVIYPKIESRKRSLRWDAFFEIKVLPVSIIMFMATVVYGGVVSFIVVYGKNIGIQNGGLFFLVYALALSFVRPFAGKIQDSKGPNLILTAGFIFLSLGFVALSASTGLPLFITAAIIMGIGNGMVWPTLQTMIINMVEPQRRGVANSTYMSALDLGIGGGSIMLGWLAEVTSISTMYMASAVFLILPLIYFRLYVAKDYKVKMEKMSHQ